MIYKRDVDTEIQSYNAWKKALIKEDEQEGLGVVSRPENCLYSLYSDYRKAQESKEFSELRAELKGERPTDMEEDFKTLQSDILKLANEFEKTHQYVDVSIDIKGTLKKDWNKYV